MIETEEGAQEFVRQRCDSQAMARFTCLLDNLRSENELQNLVARPTLAAAWVRHIADSAQLIDHVPHETSSWLDLGTGAGFPGLAIAVMRPSWNIHLVESRTRRSAWLERTVADMSLRNVRIYGMRLEQVQSFEADVISARAFAPLTKLLKLSARFSTADTQWVLPKGRSAEQEVSELPKRLQKMFHVEQSRTSRDSGIIVGRGKVEMKA